MRSGQPADDRPTQEQPTSPRDLPGWAQVFGSAVTVLTAAATAATLGGAAVALLVALSATALCSALFLAVGHGSWGRRKKAAVLISSVAAVGFVVAAAALAAAGRGSSTSTSIPTSAVVRDTSAVTPEGLRPHTPLLEKSGLRLTPSSDPLTNIGDKVDLDTGCPGWGPTGVRVGRSRCGELADLIVEEHELHAPEHAPRLVLLDSGRKASEVTCREQTTTAVGAVRLADLTTGSALCVRTDKGDIATVHVDGVAQDLVISFEVWPG